jgi:hypothetical protein
MAGLAAADAVTRTETGLVAPSPRDDADVARSEPAEVWALKAEDEVEVEAGSACARASGVVEPIDVGSPAWRAAAALVVCE